MEGDKSKLVLLGSSGNCHLILKKNGLIHAATHSDLVGT